MFKENIGVKTAEERTDTDKDAIAAGVSLEIIRSQGEVVGFRMFCKKSVNGAALDFCRTMPDRVHLQKIKVGIDDSFRSLIFYDKENVGKSSIKFALNQAKGRILQNILAGHQGELHLYEYAAEDNNFLGFEIKT